MEGKTDNSMTSKERIKKAWEENDLVALFKEGIDSFLSLLSQRPVPFETFLNEIGGQIDRRIPTLVNTAEGPSMAERCRCSRWRGRILNCARYCIPRRRMGSGASHRCTPRPGRHRSPIGIRNPAWPH